MKSTIVTLLATAMIAGAAHQASCQTAQANVLNNSGFEESIEVDLGRAFPDLMTGGVKMVAGAPSRMPIGVGISYRDGWDQGSGNNKRFECVEGTAGKEVHGGRRAIRVTSHEQRVGVMVGGSETIYVSLVNSGRTPVDDEAGLHERSLVRNKSGKFSFYAMGHGKVCVYFYCYNFLVEQPDAQQLYQQNFQEPMFVVEPREVALEPDSWQKCEFAVAISNPQIRSVHAVILVQGDVTIDDVSLTQSSGTSP